MVAYSDIHFEDLKNLSLKSFTEVLINDIYPFFYNEIHALEEYIARMKSDYDVEMLETMQKVIYAEFDELFRKEKVVLFPYLIKLDEENNKSQNCTPFKNTKVHYTSMAAHIATAKDIVSNYYVTDANNETILNLNSVLTNLGQSITDIQFIKEKHFFKNYKNCTGCKSINE